MYQGLPGGGRAQQSQVLTAGLVMHLASGMNLQIVMEVLLKLIHEGATILVTN